MIRFVIIGGVVALAFTLFSLVDAAMSEPSRSRGVSKPVWVVLTILLPVIGGILWFTIGKGPVGSTARSRAVEDDPMFSGKRMSNAELDAHMRELEERLRELDAETFPGEGDVELGGAGDGPQGAQSGSAGAQSDASGEQADSKDQRPDSRGTSSNDTSADSDGNPDDDSSAASGR